MLCANCLSALGSGFKKLGKATSKRQLLVSHLHLFPKVTQAIKLVYPDHRLDLA